MDKRCLFFPVSRSVRWMRDVGYVMSVSRSLRWMRDVCYAGVQEFEMDERCLLCQCPGV